MLGNMQKVSFQKRDLEHAAKFASAEKYHLLSFSDGAISTEHIVRVVQLETAQMEISQQLNKL